MRDEFPDASALVVEGADRWPLPAEAVLELLDRLTDAVLVVDRDWYFRYANGPAERMLDRPPASLRGKRLWSEFPEAESDQFGVAFRAAMSSGEPRTAVGYYPPLEGWFEVRAFPREDMLIILVRDVSDQRRAEAELREHVDRISEAERIVHFGIWRWEIASGRVEWSDELHRIYGLPPGSFGGTAEAFSERLHPGDRERVWANISHSITTLEPFVFEERILRADGAERVLLSRGHVIAGADGTAAALVGVCHDVTDRVAAERALGASERRMTAIMENTPSMIAVTSLAGEYLMANAEFARVAGMSVDELIGMRCADVFSAEIAEVQRASEQQAASDGVAVYDEIGLLRDDELRSFVTVTFPLPDERGLPAEVCMIATDVTERKEREGERHERAQWQGRIATALAEDRMLVFAQPIVHLATGERRSVELLVRMQPADGHAEPLAPAEFLPAAERFGLVQSIDVWMVRQALALPGPGVLQVNLSAVTMCDPAARLEIVALLAGAPEAARRITFEITETAAAEHLHAARAFARDITDLGGRLALDDFGVGFGSFTYLRSLPLSTLKIDRSFVTGLVNSRDDRRVVSSIIGIAREFGLQTVAEGVEDQRTLELVRWLGADFAQGYHIGRPTRSQPVVGTVVPDDVAVEEVDR